MDEGYDLMIVVELKFIYLFSMVIVYKVWIRGYKFDLFLEIFSY